MSKATTTEDTAEGFILTAETVTRGTSSSIVLYAASSLGPLRISKKFSPYFFVTDDKELDEPHSLRSLAGERVRKIIFPTTREAEASRVEFRKRGYKTFESDIRLRDRFLMDNRICGGFAVRGPSYRNGSLLCFDEPQLEPSKSAPALLTCSLDIETSMAEGTILSIGAHLSGRDTDARKVFMRGDVAQSNEFLHFVPDEKSLLTTFLRWFCTVDPDLIIGWNVIGFDLSFLLARATHLQIPLLLGRDSREITLSERSGRFSRATVPGRIVLDGPQLLRSSFHSFESYSLESVSQSVLGEGKLISSNEGKGQEIDRLFREDKKALADYNLKDCILVSRIFEHLELIELTMRRSELSGMLLDNVGMSVASLDHYLVPRIHEAGFVAPDVEDIHAEGTSSGGYVMSPSAGIYDGVIGLDFQSLYPSIIRTFFIDPLSLACRQEDTVRTPSGHTFSKSRAILADFIARLINERKNAKQAHNKPLSQAIKILMNSFYGVMGTPGSRMYHPDLPDAITESGQWLLMQSRSYLEERGHNVIYGDTDSLFVKPSKSDRDVQEQGTEIAADMTRYWSERLSKEFGVESHLTLEFKEYYRKFLVPAARSGLGGTKKRYAGLICQADGSEKLEFVGLEVVRSDWTKLAQDFQTELYGKVFRGEELRTWLRRYVEDLRAGTFDEKLVYRKRLHKPVSEYGKSPPPYVRAAKQLAKPGRSVRYIFTKAGPVPVELSPVDPDYNHYIDKQLQPVADAVLELLGTSFHEMVTSRQLKLF